MTYQYRHLIDCMGVGLLVLEQKAFRIIDFNRSACRMLGKRPEEMVGLPISALGDAFGELENSLARNASSRDIPARAFCIEHNGRSIYINAVHEERGGVLIVSFADITMELCRDREEAHLLESLLTHSPDPMFIMDRDGQIVRFYWEHGGEFGFDTSAVEGNTLERILDLKDQQLSGSIDLSEDSREYTFSFSVDTNGGRRIFRARLIPYRSSEMERLLFLGVCEDITSEQQQRTVDERFAREIDFRKDFIMTAAHELRTPLQPLIGYLNILLEDAERYGLGDQVREMLRRCLENVERERYIVDRMLELSLLYEGRYRLNPVRLPLRKLVLSVIESGGFDGNADFAVDVPEDTMITADRDCLYSVLLGLISNAVQFSSPPRKVWVSYSSSQSDHFISVRDNGIGISGDEIEHIFEPFHLPDGERLNRTFNRMGLSLSIARNYIKLHGGEIHVESEVGKGSTFTIRIPRRLGDGL